MRFIRSVDLKSCAQLSIPTPEPQANQSRGRNQLPKAEALSVFYLLAGEETAAAGGGNAKGQATGISALPV